MIRALAISYVLFLVGCTTIPPEEMIGKPVKITSYPKKVFIDFGLTKHPEMLSCNDHRKIYKGKLTSLNDSTITIGLLDEWEKTYVMDFDELFAGSDQSQQPWAKGKHRLNYCQKLTIDRDRIEKIELIK